MSLTGVLAGYRARLFEGVEFVKNDRVDASIFKTAKNFGASFVPLQSAGKSGKTTVYIGVPGQARKGSDSEDLIHPWFILFSISTFSVPPKEWFSIARIEADLITNMWECAESVGKEANSFSEKDLLQDLLSDSSV